MSRRRFYATPDAFTESGTTKVVTLAPEEARHLRDVLRMRAGDEAFVFDGEGAEYRCAVCEVGRGSGGRATLRIEERVTAPHAESPLDLTLFVALLKGEKFDLVVQKATELGVTGIVPVVTKRADVRPRDGEDAAKRVARWQRLALEAAKQSGRARVPKLAPPVALNIALSEMTLDGGASRLMFAERGGVSLNELSELKGEHVSSVTALVGPEGGWENEEISRAQSADWTIITLGGRTLRAETAAIVVTALLQHLFGDLK
ncbi:MAG TPA: 16S rRNA (uracil(1498)-N(3))-methyltransferase [Pyrinomonadaceae bacterium]|jgi:16S rRNA (uracil1498-N3)-methyltransferase|nr:16S rRNA (uracil(1498)-N(3))-methyltransferase [Pyrinomonadaceae bacterium]